MPRVLITLIILNLLFVVLAWPGFLDSARPLLAAEAFLLAGMFLLLPPSRGQRLAARLAGILFVVAALLTGFEQLIQTSLGRPLVVYLDIPLLRSAYDLSLTNLGGLATAAIAIGGTTAIVLLIVLFARMLTQLSRHDFNHRTLAAGIMMTLGAGLVALSFGTRLPVSAAGLQALWQQIERTGTTVADNRAFARTADDRADTREPVPLDALSERNVLLVFIESYGMQTLTRPEYAITLDRRLRQMQQTLQEQGLNVASGRLEAPIEGGQSWLAHGTVLSGLWIDNQIDYETMLASGLPTLVDDFNISGHDTLAVIPANTRDWPAGRQYGFDKVFDSNTMDYQGPAMNFFTMPDQYTLSWLYHRVLADRDDTPAFVMVPLISSHAPWVPVLPVLDWDDIGDGSVFHGLGDGQPTPDELFQDQDAVRDFYIRSVDYSLQVTTEFAARYMDDDALMMVIGDHEAPPMVAGSGVNREVPVHIISRDSALIDTLLKSSDDSTLHSGTRPDIALDSPGPRMDDVRQWLHQWFGAQTD